MTRKSTFTVLIIDNFHLDPEHDFIIEGFLNKESAIEFAKRWVRSSIEDLRKKYSDFQELKQMWYMFGEDAIVLDTNYKGSNDLDFFIEHIATKEEINWKSIERKTNSP